jgi:thermostable 8-oxoguanine DNA glycosylase
MINLDEVTNFNRSVEDLEEFALFSVLVAGKTAKTMVRCLNSFLIHHKNITPFEYVRKFTEKDLALGFKLLGIGCYNSKAKSAHQLANATLNLFTCTHTDLEKIYGIAEKTSRFFLLHTRPNQRLAVLDRHILRYMRDQGYQDIPENTPKGLSYRRIEKLWLNHCDLVGKSSAELDLEVWYKYSGYNHENN